MLSRFIVSSFEVFIEIALWLFLVGCLVSGWTYGGFLGAIGGLAGGFVFTVLFFGAFLVLFDIRKIVRAIETRHNS